MRVSRQTGFLLLIISQALHSIEEYAYRLWEVFAPARIISGLVSDNLTLGFIVVNVSVVTFGFWCYAYPVRRAWSSATIFAWFWVFLELGNSIGHTYFAIAEGGYFPGFYTVPLLFLCACYVAYRLVQGRQETTVFDLSSS